MKHIKLIIFITSLMFTMVNCQSKKYILKSNVDKVVSKYNKSMLLGANVGIYYEESLFMNIDFLNHLHNLSPGIIRMPGGSWSNELYWNGNKVRLSEESYIDKETWDEFIKNGKNPIEVAFDTTRYKNGKWNVDYSGYSPGFRIKDNEHHLSDFHGFTDVLFLHKFIRALGAETMVTVNMGTGTVKMAVEWVKWIKNRGDYSRKPFNVKYWEMGNELDGKWELGYVLPDGSKMDSKEYIRRYKLFANAMKKEDPTIKVGGSVASSMRLVYIEELIKDTDAPIDFISFHAYPSAKNDVEFIVMADKAIMVNEAVKKIKNWIAEYRPNQKNNIEIAVTEWNIKVKEDITTVDIRNALWSSVMIGEMAKAGVDIAMQWDMFSTTSTGGHGMFNPGDMTPRSQYWATYLWSNYMGNKLVKLEHDTLDFIRVYSTIDDNYNSVMIINGSENQEIDIELQFPNVKRKVQGEEISFSREQFLLNTETLKPIRSERPIVKSIIIKSKKNIKLVPYSIKIIRVPIKK